MWRAASVSASPVGDRAGRFPTYLLGMAAAALGLITWGWRCGDPVNRGVSWLLARVPRRRGSAAW